MKGMASTWQQNMRIENHFLLLVKEANRKSRELFKERNANILILQFNYVHFD